MADWIICWECGAYYDPSLPHTCGTGRGQASGKTISTSSVTYTPDPMPEILDTLKKILAILEFWDRGYRDGRWGR